MTACVNRKHTKKVAAVVTASLVGALSLGAAPVAAMADTGIETLAANWATGAKITSANDGKGGNVSDPMRATLSKGKYLVPTEVTNSLGDVTEIDDSFQLIYTGPAGFSGFKVPAGNLSYADTAFASAGNGTYYVQIEDAEGNKTDPIAFKIGSQSTVEKVHAYVGSDPDNTAIYYTGKPITFNFADEDGTQIIPDTTKTVTWTGVDGGVITSAIENPGTYYVEFTDTKGVARSVEVVVSQLDLSTAAVTMADTDSSNPVTSAADLLNKIKVNGFNIDANDFKVTSMSTPDGTNNWNQTGEFTVTIAGKNTGYAKNSATITFSQLDNNVFTDYIYDVKYGSKSFGTDSDGDYSYAISLLDGESFDASKISVVDDTNGVTYKGDQLELTFSKNGEVIDASDITEQGTYDLHIRIKPVQDFATSDWTGGSKDVKIKLIGTKLDADQTLGFYLDGEIMTDGQTAEYTGEDFLDSITTVVKDSEGNTYEAGTDYTVEVKNLNTGKEVDSIVSAAKYELTVTPKTFTFDSASDNTIEFEVTKVTIDNLVADVDNMEYDADETTGDLETVTVPTDTNPHNIETNKFYVAYTGSAVEVPGVLYGKFDSAEAKWSYKELPSDIYTIVSIKNDKTGKTVKEAVDEGDYTVKVALTDEAKDNYNLPNTKTTFTFTIKKFGHFTDVDATKWYAVPVEKAADLGYVNGISGTNLFAPEADITRADAICILFNMAKGTMDMDDFEFSETSGWVTGFTDVDGHAYYAQPLAWAKAFGVANGYGDGTFAPNAKITREEFASMLANYAKAMGKFETASEGALDSMSDANTVSDWAEANVAWAVENGVMGNGGFVAGQSNITRAEVAAMAVNYQPEALEK